jgi:hypothetical protein
LLISQIDQKTYNNLSHLIEQNAQDKSSCFSRYNFRITNFPYYQIRTCGGLNDGKKTIPYYQIRTCGGLNDGKKTIWKKG